MKHRHIDDIGWTLAALDSLLERGDLPDWMALIEAMKKDRSIKDRLLARAEKHEHLKIFVEMLTRRIDAER